MLDPPLLPYLLTGWVSHGIHGILVNTLLRARQKALIGAIIILYLILPNNSVCVLLYYLQKTGESPLCMQYGCSTASDMHLLYHVLREHTRRRPVRCPVTAVRPGPIPRRPGPHLAVHVPPAPTLHRPRRSPPPYLQHRPLACSSTIDSMRRLSREPV